VYQQKIVIVGAGIVGLSTAYALLKQGMKQVTILEQALVDHRRSTSHGLSRLLRFEYGSQKCYTQMVQLSLNRWESLERASRRTLYTPTGLLMLGNEHDNFTRASYHVLRESGVPVKSLSRHECITQFPQFNTEQYDLFTYNANGGILHASICLNTLKEMILEMGGTIREHQRVTHIAHESQHYPIRLHLSGGETLTAERVVLATGPWVHRLLGEQRLPIRLTRQYVLYFANLPTSSFRLHTFPAFMVDDLYGLPIHSTCSGHGPNWLKGTSHTFGESVDPDEIPRVDDQVITQIARRLRALLPTLEQAELAHVDSCIYDVSPDEDFILDYLPDDSRLVFATGLTGHGFKFGPLLGELLSSLVRETRPPIAMERFQMARFEHYGSVHAGSVA
jgi:monomeric sarcosine oxidase